MIDTVEITINGKKYKYSKDITIEEVLADHPVESKYPIIVAKLDNRLRELSWKIKDDATLEGLDLTSPEGNRVHINGLILVMLYAINNLFGETAKIRVEHSLDKGIFIKTKFPFLNFIC